MYYDLEPKEYKNPFNKMEERKQRNENENVFLCFYKSMDQVNNEENRKGNVEKPIRNKPKAKIKSASHLINDNTGGTHPKKYF